MHLSLDKRFRLAAALLIVVLGLHGEGFARQAGDYREAPLQPAPDTTRAFMLYSRANGFKEQAAYDSAYFYFLAAYDEYSRINSYEKCVNTLCNLAIVARLQGDYNIAAHHLNNALLIGNNTLDVDNNKHMAVLYNQLGVLYRIKSEYDQALHYFVKALEIRKRIYGDRHIRVGVTLNSLGLLYLKLGDYQRCIDYLTQSLACYEAHYGENHYKTAIVYANLGVTHVDIGDIDASIFYLQKALEINESMLAPHHPNLASNYMQLARSYSFKGDFDKVFLYFNKAFAIIQHTFPEAHDETALAYSFIAIIHKAINEYDQAIELFNKAIGIWEAIHGPQYGEIALSLKHLGDIYFEQANYGEALATYRQALSIYRANYSGDFVILAKIYKQLGHVYLEKNHFEQALSNYNECLRISQQGYGEKHLDIAEAYWGLGNLFLRQEKFSLALVHYQKGLTAITRNFEALDFRLNPGNHSDFIDPFFALKVLNAKAKVLFEWGLSLEKSASPELISNDQSELFENAVATYELGFDLIDYLNRNYRGEYAKLKLLREIQQIHRQSIAMAYRLQGRESLPKIANHFFQFLEKSKAVILTSAIQEIDAKKFSRIPEALLEEEKSLREKIRIFDLQLEKENNKYADRDSLKINFLNSRLLQLTRSYDELIDGLEANYPGYYALKYRNRLHSIREFQRKIPEGTVLLEYFAGEDQLYLLALSSGDYTATAIPRDSSLNELIEQFGTALRRESEGRFFAERSARLYDRLIRPVAAQIAGKKKLVIIPDGALYYIPFEALIRENSPGETDYTRLPYLVREYDVSYHYSAHLYLQGLEKVPASGVLNFAGFAPVFSGEDDARIIEGGSPLWGMLSDAWEQMTRNGRHFGELPYSETEVRRIVQAFDWEREKSAGFIARAATKVNFKAQAGKYRYLHLATHSFVNEAQPNLSGIAFFPPEDSTSADDGILYAGEIYNLELNADLVVLSSCESGLGKLVRGEGLMAMTRGFLYAGAANVMVSLWQVFDKHTSELMVGFYRQMLQGKSYATALREAKLQLIDNPLTAFPGSWSSFVLIGR